MKQSRLYHYLEASGVLDTGSPEDITRARLQYRNQQKAQWRRNKRALSKSITVYFSLKEYATIQRIAQRFNRTPTNFVSHCAFTTARNEPVTLHNETTLLIHEALMLTYHRICDIAESQHIPEATQTVLVSILQEVQATITAYLQHPKNIEAAVQDALVNNNVFRETLITMLKQT